MLTIYVRVLCETMTKIQYTNYVVVGTWAAGFSVSRVRTNMW